MPEGMQMIHIMDGVPVWLGIVGIALIIIVSHALIHFKSKKPESKTYTRISMFKFKPFKWLVHQSYFPIMAQSISLLLLILVVSAGLWGNQKTNIAPVITWTWWWVLLIFFTLGFGKLFCMVCPWEALSSLVTALYLKTRVKKLGFEKAWPKWARNIFPAIGFFILLTWFELRNPVTRSPSTTASLS